MITSSQSTSFVLRLPRSTKDTAAMLAAEDGISLNLFISLAVVERITRMEAVGSAKLVKGVHVRKYLQE